MLVDMQLMMTARIFAGKPESFHTCTSLLMPPSGVYKTHCNVLDETRKCALVSRLWQKEFREWRRKELEKVFEGMLVGALDGAFDMCDRECYPYKTGPPLVSTLQHELYLQGIKVFAVTFRRTGAKFRHSLLARVSHDVPTGMMDVREVWRVKTPISGWKKMRLMSEQEIDQWNEWVHAERLALHAWIRSVMGFEALPVLDV